MQFFLFNYSIKKENIPKFIDRLKREYEIIAPVKQGKDYNFQTINFAQELNLADYQNTRFSPKKFFLPNPETLFVFKKNNKFEMSTKIGNEKRVIFGLRPCDVNGINTIDKVFIDAYKDPFYQKRRNNTILIALNCNKVGDYCFCESLGTNYTEASDLLLTDLGNEYIVEVQSEIGNKIVKNNEDLFAINHQIIKKPELKCKRKVNPNKLVELLKKGFNNKIWEKEADRCISCAACTMVCPTCYCYDIEDVMNINGKEGERIRQWGYCMLLNFTRVAGGHVFRESRSERLKQFVLHKLCYFKEVHDKFLCIGCGRCIQSCIVNIDLTEIANKLSGKK